MAANDQVPVMGYWAIRGLAQPIRLLCAYAGQPLKEELYVQKGPEENYSRQEWYDAKYKQGLDFPNLPYLKVGDFKITESKAIMQYFARKHNLMGSTLEDEARVVELIMVVAGWLSRFTSMSYNPEHDKLRGPYLEALVERLDLLAAYVKDRKFALGEHISAADFQAYEFLDVNLCLEPTCLDKYPSLKAWHDRVEALPGVAKYMKSPEFIRRPINNTVARFK